MDYRSEISHVSSYNWFIVVEKNIMDMFIKVVIASQNMQIWKYLLIPFLFIAPYMDCFIFSLSLTN